MDRIDCDLGQAVALGVRLSPPASLLFLSAVEHWRKPHTFECLAFAASLAEALCGTCRPQLWQPRLMVEWF